MDEGSTNDNEGVNGVREPTSGEVPGPLLGSFVFQVGPKVFHRTVITAPSIQKKRRIVSFAVWGPDGITSPRPPKSTSMFRL